MERIADGSPMPKPRVIGLVYLSYALVSLLGDFFLKRVVVTDPAATVANLLTHEATYRAGIAITLLANVLYLILTALFYRLLKPVDRTISLLMGVFGLVGCTTQIIACLLLLAPLVVLRDTQLLGAFTNEQLRAAALASIKIYSQAFSISFVLFGLFDFMLGNLIFRSTFLPRILGVLMMIAGVFAMIFLYPPLALAYKWVVLPVAGLPEVALMLWLIIKGVDVARWEERAAPAVARPRP